jgi:hypothetical protein
MGWRPSPRRHTHPTTSLLVVTASQGPLHCGAARASTAAATSISLLVMPYTPGPSTTQEPSCPPSTLQMQPLAGPGDIVSISLLRTGATGAAAGEGPPLPRFRRLTPSDPRDVTTYNIVGESRHSAACNHECRSALLLVMLLHPG